MFKGLEKVTGIKAAKIKNVLESLNAFSLVYLEEDTFNIHRLTSTFVTTSKMENSERKKTHILAAEYFDGKRDKEKKILLEDAFEARWHLLQAEEWDRAVEFTRGMIEHLSITGYPQLAFQLLAEISVKPISDKNRAALYHFQGILYHDFGDYDEALKQYKKALEIREKIGDIKGISLSLLEIGITYQYKGDYDRGLKQLKKAKDTFTKIGDISGVSKVLHHIGMICEYKGDYDEALKQYEKSLEIKEKIGDIKGISDILHQIGMIYQLKDDYDYALKLYEESLEIRKKIGDISGTASSLGLMGTIYFETKDYTKALKSFITAFLIFSKLGSPNVKKARKDILNVKQFVPGEHFNDILNEFNLPSDIFDEQEEEGEEKKFYEFMFNITSQAVNAKEKNTNEKEPVIKMINEILEQIPGNAPDQEGLITYFQMLLAYLADEDYKKYKENIP
ncbi:MAG: tetratricopeptide repeat protein, partial [Candidatus Aminicenantes bacterium]